MSTQKSNQNLIWVDLEMTGLDKEGILAKVKDCLS